MRTSRFKEFLASILMLSIILIAPVSAQATTGDITGRVLDAQGNVVVNATVTIRNMGTGETRTATTNDEGVYLISQLAPGMYEIAVEAQGFSRTLLKDHQVSVGTKETLNFDLKPGNVAETVEVAGGAPLIETTKSEIGGVVTPVEVQNLPLLNRTFAALSAIMPEARPVGNFDPTKTRVGNVALNGGDGRQLDVNVDGGDNKDNVVGSLLQNFAYEGIQEFQVLQHRWTAEHGRSVGGVVNVVTKSGSNNLHGSFFSNFRDEKLRAKDFFEKQRDDIEERAGRDSIDKPPFSRQEIGGSIGGKIITDKLFYFGALERFRERQNNQVPATLLPQLAAIPGIDPIGDIPTPYDDWLLTTKVDHRISDKQSMYYRFAFQDNSSPNDQIGVPANADPTGGNTNDNRLYSFIANHTYAISPSKVNVFAFHFQDFKNEILGVTDTPLITFPSVTTGRNPNVPQSTLERKYQFRDDFSVLAGAHALKFGANYINTKLDGFFFFGAQGYAITFFDDPLTIRNNLNGLYPQGFATPGAVRQITFSDGRGDHTQKIHQLAFYFQDDYKVSSRLTLNLGLRWDANIGNLPDQTNNRTMLILQRLNHPLAQAITDPDKLDRTTPSWTEFQPRLGFAYDPKGDGRMVIRGGYGIFYDQLFQNLTLFSLTQTNPEIFQTILSLTNNAVGTGQLANFRFGVDPLPPVPAGTTFTDLAVGGFGRINDPDAREPYVQKFSIGFQKSLGESYVLSSDYVHTLGLHESRVQVVNPRIRHICDPTFPGSTPGSSECVRGANSRVFDRAFVEAGLPANRIEQINMIGTTNRSLFDSWTTQLRGRFRRTVFNVSYTLASSRSWGGQPVASYSGNGIAIDPRLQFREEEFGPTRIDERHRFVLSGVFDLPWGIQLAPIAQLASSRPYSLNAGIDLDGDGLATNDRLCEGSDARAVLESLLTTGAPPPGSRTPGCTQLEVNSQRKGFIVDADGNIEERSGRFFNVDLRVGKTFSIGEDVRIKGYADFYNLFNTENLSFANRLGMSSAASVRGFAQPVSLYGPGFGPPVGRPFTVQLGFRVDF
ncbi:MAG TPA: TonB-dependent receptor [Blastocatellia bacterium]|nr:TonB-dependent receptor [Blastocatellia bacterium]